MLQLAEKGRGREVLAFKPYTAGSGNGGRAAGAMAGLLEEAVRWGSQELFKENAAQRDAGQGVEGIASI
jgi:hypothetical protein